MLKKNLKKILFLGYDRYETSLIDVLEATGITLHHSNQKDFNYSGYDLIISFGYRHIIQSNVLCCGTPIINLHISYLPYNRGAHPNFWSFYDNSPSGVTIHLIDQGIDTGDILYQKEISFLDHEDTFQKTHKRLSQEIEALFITNMNEIIDASFSPAKQVGTGSYHQKSDLPKNFTGWSANIDKEIKRLKQNAE